MAGFTINYEEMKEQGIFDYVSNHYWEMSKEQLANICKELSFAVHSSTDNKMSNGQMGESIEKEAIRELIKREV